MINTRKLLDERLVFIDADVKTSEEAIRLMAGRLQECGYVNEGYADMVIAREKVFPTGLPGKEMSIAIPHTDPTLVNKPAIGVIVPKESVEFSMMGEPEHKLDVKLMHVIQDSDRLAKIRASRNKAEILDLLSSLEEA